MRNQKSRNLRVAKISCNKEMPSLYYASIRRLEITLTVSLLVGYGHSVSIRLGNSLIQYVHYKCNNLIIQEEVK